MILTDTFPRSMTVIVILLLRLNALHAIACVSVVVLTITIAIRGVTMSALTSLKIVMLWRLFIFSSLVVFVLMCFSMSRKKMDFSQPFCGVRAAEWMSISQAFYRLNLPLRSPVNFSPEEYIEFHALLGVVECAIIRMNNLENLPLKYKFELKATQIDPPLLFDFQGEGKDDLPF